MRAFVRNNQKNYVKYHVKIKIDGEPTVKGKTRRGP